MVRRIEDGVGEKVREQLRERAVDRGTDVHRLIEEFVHNEPGARILYSEGRGKVSIFLPERDEYEDMDRLNFFPPSSKTNTLYVAKRSPSPVEIPGVGRCFEYVVEPLGLRADAKAAGAKDRIGLSGEGFVPFGFEDAFYQEFIDVLVLLANEGGVRLGGETRVDARDRNWQKLDGADLEFVQRYGGHVGGSVVSTETIERALQAEAVEDGVKRGARQSLKLILDAPEATDGERAVKRAHMSAEEEARPVLERVLGGKEAFDPDGFPRELVLMADLALRKKGRTQEVETLRKLLAGDDVDIGLVSQALDAVFGRGFTADRKITAGLVEAILEDRMENLDFTDIDALRTLRAEIRNVARAELYGVDPGERALSDKRGAAKVREVHRALMKTEGLDDAATALLARELVAAANAPAGKPKVIIIAGGGRSADAAFHKAAELTGAKHPLRLTGSDLGNRDPVGVAKGTPDGQLGLMRGLMVRDAPQGEPSVMVLDGAESIGQSTTDPAEQKRAQSAYWSFLAEGERTGGFTGYDPNDPKKGRGAPVDFPRIMLVRDRRPIADILDGMTPEVRAQVGARVIDFGHAKTASVIEGIVERIREHMETANDVADAEVQLGDGARAFFNNLLSHGMDPATLEALVLQEVQPTLLFLSMDGDLVPRVKVDLVDLDLLLDDERAKLEDSWLKGQPISLPGIGGSIFQVYDAGTGPLDAKAKLSLKLERKIQRDEEMRRLQKLVDRYKDSATFGDQTIRKLVAENQAVHQKLGQATGRIQELSFEFQRAVWEVEDMRRVNEEAKKAIRGLEADVAKANATIDQLNRDKVALQDRYEGALADANARIARQNQEKAELRAAADEIDRARQVALQERDQITNQLRMGEDEAGETIKAIAQMVGQRDPRQAFLLVQELAWRGGANHRYLRPFIVAAHAAATGQALNQALEIARAHNYKAQEITELAQLCFNSAQAAGIPIDAQTRAGFESAARASNYYGNFTNYWQQQTGYETQYPGADPNWVSQQTDFILGRLLGIRRRGPNLEQFRRR